MKKIAPIFSFRSNLNVGISLIALSISLFLAVPFAFADISIETEQNTYNLGNKIRVSASLMQDKGFDGLFRVEILCRHYALPYFLTPLSLEANFRTAINVPEIAAASPMLGNCTMAGSLLTNDNLVVEQEESNSFVVTDQMAILPAKYKISSLPSQSIHVAGVLNEAFGNNALKASLKITLDNKSYDLETDYGEFNLTVLIPKDIKSGIHTIGITSSDLKGNRGAASIELEITAIPTHIKIDLSGDELPPGSKVSIIPYLYDQSDDLVNDTLELEMISPKGGKIFRRAVQSNAKVEHEFSQYAEPGSYALTGSYKALLSHASINITVVKEVKIEYKNETVFVDNVGNVPFEEELTFILESGLKKYPITKRLSVEPGKSAVVDLSREVPSGIYDVAIKNINKTFDGINGNSISSILPEKVLAAGASIHDNRPVYKKLASGLSSISGALVGSDGVLSKNPLLAPLILGSIVLLIIARYAGKPIIRMIRGKKEEEAKK